VLFGTHTGPGAFYRLMPHNTMAALFGAVFLYAIVALLLGVRSFWRSIGDPVSLDGASLWQAIRDAGNLRYLDGGGIGCYNHDERPNDQRRFYHHQTFYGFMLCFASTSVATVYHYGFERVAPYPWWDLPVVLGTVGGVGLIFGPLGLMIAKLRRDPIMVDQARFGMEFAFLAMLFLTSATGLLLLVLRATPAMPLLLALHLGVVFALFITIPYGKFVHGIYRFVALVRYAAEHKAFVGK
jgi:citrate/tricarballylate utilization protein